MPLQAGRQEGQGHFSRAVRDYLLRRVVRLVDDLLRAVVLERPVDRFVAFLRVARFAVDRLRAVDFLVAFLRVERFAVAFRRVVERFVEDLRAPVVFRRAVVLRRAVDFLDAVFVVFLRVGRFAVERFVVRLRVDVLRARFVGITQCVTSCSMFDHGLQVFEYKNERYVHLCKPAYIIVHVCTLNNVFYMFVCG